MTEKTYSSQPSGAGTCRDSVSKSLTYATACLRDRTDNPRLEAELLLSHVKGCSRAELYARSEELLRGQERASFAALLERRAGGEPLPYLLGHIEFYGLDFAVDHRVLIPRPETETLVNLALAFISNAFPHLSDPGTVVDFQKKPVLADIGTGSGCIAINLAIHVPHGRIYAVDISQDALAMARANAQRLKVADRIIFLESDLLGALSESVDLVVANPPYIACDEWPSLSRSIRNHEPRLALYGGDDGLDVVRRLLSQAADHLRPGGAVLMEIGAKQGVAVSRLARDVFPSADITLHADLSGRDRVLCVKTTRSREWCLDAEKEK